MDDSRINELIDIFKELAELAGGYEETKIMPNLEVIDAAPADLPANFIIISDDEGFYTPAVKAAGLTVSNGDFVNVLFIKGTEPIAFQHGSSSSGGGGGGGAQNFQLYHTGVATEYATLTLANAAAVSGDTIVAYPGAYTADDVTLVDGVNLIVIDPKNTTFTTSTSQYCIRTGASSYLLNVRASVTTSHATQVGAIYLAGNNSICENCTAIGSNSHATGFSYAFYKRGATGVELRNCRGDGTGATSNDNYGFRQDTSAGSIKIVGGEYEGDANDIYVDGETIAVYNPILGQSGLIGGNGVWSGDMPNCLVIKNTSGNIAKNGNVGYIDYVASTGGEYKETTTASDNKFPSACIVIGPGVNNVNILVQMSGKAKMQYDGSAPSAGDFLLFSTTAGALTLSATMHPNLVAVAQAVGANGLVDALLYPNSKFIPLISANFVASCDNTDSSNFVAKINSGGSGGLTATNVPFDTVSAGAANTLVPVSTDLGKIRLYNSTRGTYRLITACDTANSKFTTVSSTDTWADNDDITAQSQVCLSGDSPFFYDVDLSQDTTIPLLSRGLMLGAEKFDLGAVNHYTGVAPWAAFANEARVNSVSTGALVFRSLIVSLINRRFCWRFRASGSGTATQRLRLEGAWIAAP